MKWVYDHQYFQPCAIFLLFTRWWGHPRRSLVCVCICDQAGCVDGRCNTNITKFEKFELSQNRCTISLTLQRRTLTLHTLPRDLTTWISWMKRGRAMAGSLIHQGSISVRRARLIKPMMKHFIVKITHNIRIRCTPAATDPAPWLRSRISCLRGTKFLQHSCARARLQVYLPDKTLQTYLQRLVYGFHLPEVIRSSHFRSLGTFQERIDPEEIYNAASGWAPAQHSSCSC